MKAMMLSCGVACGVTLVFGATVEQYTFCGSTSYSAVDGDTILTAIVTDGTEGNVIDVERGRELTINDLSGGGEITKTGAGRLVIRDVAPEVRLHVAAGKVVFGKSTGVADLTSAAAVHLDASAADTITVSSTSDTETKISKWTDVRGTENHPWAEYPSWSADCCPRYRYAAQNGLNYVDLRTTGASWALGSFFHMANFQGSDAEGDASGYGNEQIGIKGVKEIFLVVKDQPANGLYQSFLGDMNSAWNYFFKRGANGEIWDGSVGETEPLRKGSTWVDGVSTEPSTVFPEGFHILRARATAASQRFRTLGSYCSGQLNGGLAYGEVIVFKGDVADATAAVMTRRLSHKWFGKQTLAALAVEAGAEVESAAGETVVVNRADGLSVVVTDVGLDYLVPAGQTVDIAVSESLPRMSFGEGAVLEIAEGAVLTADHLAGTGSLTKTGSGTMVVRDLSEDVNVVVDDGVLELAKSAGVASLAGSAAIHLDASLASSVSYAWSNEVEAVVNKWTDVRGVDGYPWAQRDQDGGIPRYRYAEQNGLNVMDFGLAGKSWGNSFLRLANLQGTDAYNTGTDSYYTPEGIKDIVETFIVVKDRPAEVDSKMKYQEFLGDMSGLWNYFYKRGTNGELWDQTVGETAALRSGSNWLDGESVAHSSVFPEGFHVLRSRRSSANGRFNALCYARGNLMGGLAYGEILAFKSALADRTGAEMSRRLVHKWLGYQSAGNVTTGANGKLRVADGERLRPAKLTIGSLDVRIDCANANGAVPFEPSVVDVAAGGTVELALTNERALTRGQLVPLVRASESLVNGENFCNWTIVSDSAKWEFKPVVDGNVLYAQAEGKGLLLIVK